MFSDSTPKQTSFFSESDLSALLVLAFQDAHIWQIICSWELLVTSSIDVPSHPEYGSLVSQFYKTFGGCCLNKASVIPGSFEKNF